MPNGLRPLACDIALRIDVHCSELARLRWRTVDIESDRVSIEEAIALGQPKRPQEQEIPHGVDARNRGDGALLAGAEEVVAYASAGPGGPGGTGRRN